MKIRQVNGRTEITIHQSFLNSHMMCAKMARDDAERPEGSPPSSASAVGTTMHAGIEARLLGLVDSEMIAAMAEAYRIESEHPLFKRDMTDREAMRMASLCLAAWERDLYPRLGSYGAMEHEFRLLVDSRGDVDLYIGGMWDLLNEGELIDWKTAASMYKYQQWQVDRWFVQPTMYTWALAIETDDWSPKRFHYGIVEKSKEPQGHWVTTVRGPQDWMFLKEQMWRVVDSWSAPPTLNDQGWWCSPKWCESFSSCKGAPRIIQMPGSTLVDRALTIVHTGEDPNDG